MRLLQLRHLVHPGRIDSGFRRHHRLCRSSVCDALVFVAAMLDVVVHVEDESLPQGTGICDWCNSQRDSVGDLAVLDSRWRLRLGSLDQQQCSIGRWYNRVLVRR